MHIKAPDAIYLLHPELRPASAQIHQHRAQEPNTTGKSLVKHTQSDTEASSGVERVKCDPISPYPPPQAVCESRIQEIWPSDC